MTDGRGFYSIGMDVEDLTSTLAELKSKGIKITKGPLPTTAGSLAFIEDPNGVRICLDCC
ncbi:VOC family protein [Desulfitobacterium dichloroeliminans]|uniref:VOC family protein n=1 Tax=Desulfitobacterium dichloroeliminans TaxID=233055 RepID=UPI003D0613EF